MADVEDLIDELRNYITDNWAAKARTVNAAHKADADPIEIEEDLAAVFIAEQSLEQVSQYPIVYLLADRSRNETFQAAGDDDWSIRVDIGVFEIDRDRERLQRKMFRYVEDVIWALLKDAHVASPKKLTWHLGTSGELVEVDWGAILTRGEEFMNDARLTVRFRK
jgi:hypothetical protein